MNSVILCRRKFSPFTTPRGNGDSVTTYRRHAVAEGPGTVSDNMRRWRRRAEPSRRQTRRTVKFSRLRRVAVVARRTGSGCCRPAPVADAALQSPPASSGTVLTQVRRAATQRVQRHCGVYPPCLSSADPGKYPVCGCAVLLNQGSIFKLCLPFLQQNATVLLLHVLRLGDNCRSSQSCVVIPGRRRSSSV